MWPDSLCNVLVHTGNCCNTEGMRSLLTARHSELHSKQRGKQCDRGHSAPLPFMLAANTGGFYPTCESTTSVGKVLLGGARPERGAPGYKE